jgi:hypothetical protein
MEILVETIPNSLSTNLQLQLLDYFGVVSRTHRRHADEGASNWDYFLTHAQLFIPRGTLNFNGSKLLHLILSPCK